ncbi:MAG: FxLYD domain-containing protein [Halobacteriota archaeon]|jgi:hypothetical protein
MAPPTVTRSCALLILVLLAVSFAGCLTEQPNNETTHSTVNAVNITHTYYYTYNGTSYLTGIIKNVGTQNLVDVSLQAEGYANNTTYERGYAGPETGVNSTLLPGETTPFMIKMLPVAFGGASTTAPNQTQVTSANFKTAASTRNVTSNNSKTQTSTQPAKKYNLSYRILLPDYKLSNENPYPLAIVNDKTTFFNRTISVSGEVYNGGTENVNSSVVAVALYRKDGNVLGVFVGKPQGELAPEKTAPFQIYIPRNFSISLAEVARTEVYAYKFTS